MFTVTSYQDTIKVTAPERIEKQLRSEPFLETYIPNVSVNRHKNPLLNLDIRQGQHYNFSGIDATYKLTLPEDQEVDTKGIITVIDYCLERQRQQAGRYTIHGSAVSSGDKAVLFIGGASGLGKTSLALQLYEKNLFSLIGDDRVIIDNSMQAVTGITKLQLNKPSLRKSLSPKMQQSIQKQEFRIAEQPVPIKLVVQPIVAPNSMLAVEPWDAAKAEFHMYEELSRKIRGVSRRVQNFSLPLQSLDDDTLSLRRSELAKKLASEISFYSIYGDVGTVAAETVRLLDASR